YDMAKKIIRLLCCLSRRCAADPNISLLLQVIYLENYNVSKAERIIPAAELSQQISAAGWEASGTGNMKLAMNGALTIGTEDGANIEMRQEVGDEWWPFRFGSSADELVKLRQTNTYDPRSIYDGDTAIQKALNALTDRSLAESEEEHQTFQSIFQSLLDGPHADPYFCIKDLRNYYDTQRRVEQLYQQPYAWAELSIHNIAGMGKFSTDNSIQHYCQDIWDVQPCPMDPEILAKVRHDYSEHDRRRVFVESDPST
ncbi:MAG: glycogen/starch/alpha-glucan phosphorylase, partial [Chlamydiia bacterium]|nr:glycogen/starch/alpha-glucan phosphorylase [Chlamydiia bacterium]